MQGSKKYCKFSAIEIPSKHLSNFSFLKVTKFVTNNFKNYE